MIEQAEINSAASDECGHVLDDGQCHILDLRELYKSYNAIAVAYIDGHLWVLPKGGTEWKNVLDINSHKPNNVVGIGANRGSSNPGK